MDNSLAKYFELADYEVRDNVDLRELEAPGPMQNVLLGCAQLKPGQVYLAHLPRVPVMLFPHLEARGLRWQVHEQTDRSAVLAVFLD